MSLVLLESGDSFNIYVPAVGFWISFTLICKQAQYTNFIGVIKLYEKRGSGLCPAPYMIIFSVSRCNFAINEHEVAIFS